VADSAFFFITILPHCLMSSLVSLYVPGKLALRGSGLILGNTHVFYFALLILEAHGCVSLCKSAFVTVVRMLRRRA
jgi:hypothetical protein